MRRVVVQIGHEKPREPGFESGTGAAGELELVRKIGAELVRLLRADPAFTVQAIPGRVPAEVRTGPAPFAFVSLHADGATDPRAEGYSFGYPPGSSSSKRLAELIAAGFVAIPHRSGRRPDNYTRSLAGYYGFSRVPGNGPKVVVEHGFVSNPSERKWMHDRATQLAAATWRALRLSAGLPATPPAPAPPKPKPAPAPTAPAVRVDVDAGRVQLRGQRHDNPELHRRLVRLLATEPRVLITRSKP